MPRKIVKSVELHEIIKLLDCFARKSSIISDVNNNHMNFFLIEHSKLCINCSPEAIKALLIEKIKFEISNDHKNVLVF
jgi:hypothetical protein